MFQSKQLSEVHLPAGFDLGTAAGCREAAAAVDRVQRTLLARAKILAKDGRVEEVFSELADSAEGSPDLPEVQSKGSTESPKELEDTSERPAGASNHPVDTGNESPVLALEPSNDSLPGPNPYFDRNNFASGSPIEEEEHDVKLEDQLSEMSVDSDAPGVSFDTPIVISEDEESQPAQSEHGSSPLRGAEVEQDESGEEEEDESDEEEEDEESVDSRVDEASRWFVELLQRNARSVALEDELRRQGLHLPPSPH